MIKNTLMKFIDSCVGNIARKIEDEFRESDHPRDKGGKFTSKGGEGRGGASKKTKAHEPPVEETEFEKSAKEELNGKKGNVITTSMEFTGDEEDAKQLAKKYGFDYKLTYPKGSPYATIKMTGDKNALREYAVNEGFGSEEDAREFVPELFEGDEESGSEGADEDDEEIKAGKETDKIVEEFEGSGIDMFAAMADLGLDVDRIPEGHLAGVFEEKLFNSPKFRQKAKQYISAYRGLDPDEEEDWFK